MESDYGKLGLRVGFEIHQELDTNKLFCKCPSELREEEPPLKVGRRLRPTQSEMGEVDRAALAEVLKDKGFVYQLYPESVCLVELDEEPPHPVNDEALNITLEIALLLGAKPVDEVHAMRKTVIDGSNTCGFQRTMLVATDGDAEIDDISFRIPTVCLEEDAARKMGEDEKYVNYRLDRLGIPLVELATGPDFSDPDSPAKAALYIGQLLRATGKVKRGIGTIRQDVNVSIAGGARQEIKGVQELALISEVIKRDVQRQLALLGIRDELRQRGAEKVVKNVVDVSGVFSNSDSNLVRKSVKRGDGVFALKLPKFGGLTGKELQPGRRFGTELSDRAKLYGKVKGLFHTDELPGFGISGAEVEKLRAVLEASPEDCVILIADAREKVDAAMDGIIERANHAIDGVPEETRRALPDGNTEFMRPLPGAARMYPETDIPPIPITPARLQVIKKQLPELPEKARARLIESYGLGEELAERLSRSGNLLLFEKLVKQTKADPPLVATTLEETIVSLRREGAKIEKIGEPELKSALSAVAEGRLAKEAVPDVLKLMADGLSARDAMEKLGLGAMSVQELEAAAKEVVDANLDVVERLGEAALGPLMGMLMEKVRGKADGKLVYEVLEKEITKRVVGGS
jgi:glutamyl-tRNA(Gln) amidotransferase subunit E